MKNERLTTTTTTSRIEPMEKEICEKVSRGGERRISTIRFGTHLDAVVRTLAIDIETDLRTDGSKRVLTIDWYERARS